MNLRDAQLAHEASLQDIYDREHEPPVAEPTDEHEERAKDFYTSGEEREYQFEKWLDVAFEDKELKAKLIQVAADYMPEFYAWILDANKERIHNLAIDYAEQDAAAEREQFERGQVEAAFED